MAHDLKTIQEIVNERAFQKFRADFNRIGDLIGDSRIFGRTDSEVPNKLTNPVNNKTENPRWIFKDGSPYFNTLKDYWLPIYIAEESALFVQQVNELIEFKDTSNQDY